MNELHDEQKTKHQFLLKTKTNFLFSVQMYRMNGRMAMSGDLLGALVSDLTPKSIEASRFQE